MQPVGTIFEDKFSSLKKKLFNHTCINYYDLVLKIQTMQIGNILKTKLWTNLFLHIP